VNGPVTAADANTDAPPTAAQPAVLEVTESRLSQIGTFPVRRALPRRARRTVGPWCFIDHMGPATVDEPGLGVAPHPHIGLQTVTWVLAGGALHRDSLGTEQLIAPGQLNLMTAVHGLSHSEEGTGRYRGELHASSYGLLSPRTPETGHRRSSTTLSRQRSSSSEQSPPWWSASSQVSCRQLAATPTTPASTSTFSRGGPRCLYVPTTNTHSSRSPAPWSSMVPSSNPGSSPTSASAATSSPSSRTCQHAASSSEACRSTRLLMWWNFVPRTRDEITSAHREWTQRAERFGHVDSPLPRIDVGPPPWRRQ
jgi:hypothetical protein